jgi:hypothetical protein
MYKKYIVVCLLVVVALVFAVIGCTKTVTVVVNPGSQITTEVSFSKDLTPIFSNSCALSGCHATGGHVPNLSGSSAYQSLIVGGYVKPGDPDNSEIMLWLTGKKSPAMPLGSGPDQDIIAPVYAWIKQGALNN